MVRGRPGPCRRVSGGRRVQESVAPQLLAKLRRRLATLRVGPALDKGVDMAAIHSTAQLDRIAKSAPRPPRSARQRAAARAVAKRAARRAQVCGTGAGGGRGGGAGGRGAGGGGVQKPLLLPAHAGHGGPDRLTPRAGEPRAPPAPPERAEASRGSVGPSHATRGRCFLFL